MLNQRLQSLKEHYDTLNSQVAEVHALDLSLKEITKIQKGKEILVPLGSNIFAKAKLEDAEKLIVGVGSNVLVKKTFNETIEEIASQTLELKEILNKIETEINSIVTRLQKIQQDFSKEQ